VINDPAVVRWNLHKRYLAELAAAGIPVVPTRVMAHGRAGRVSRLLAAEGWPEAVVKPAIGVGGMGVRRVSLASASATDALAGELLGETDVVVQPYVESITKLGEVMLVFVGGRYSHAARRLPAPGGFLTHVHHGGTVEPATPDAEQLRVATRAYRAIPGSPVIARIDLVDLDCDGPAVQEAECIDPHLYPEFQPRVAGLLSDAIVSALSADTGHPAPVITSDPGDLSGSAVRPG
jgi:glutathione synthase/RimK-type ligase-like ATP-grasp enzyme